VRDLSVLRARLITAALLFAGTFATGIVGYRVIGGRGSSWIDAVYMTANVLTTAGFREAIDIHDSPAGEAFTVVLLIFGAGVLVYSTSVITAFVVEGDLTEGFRRRRMRRAVDAMAGHYVVCGAGATGWAVVRELVSTERPVVLIDQDPDRVHHFEAEMPTVPVILGDFTDDQVLSQAGITRAAGIVICTTVDKDLLVTTITARQLNPQLRIVARAANERAAARLRQAGADAVVSPALIGGMRMASELVRPHVVNFLDTMLRDKNRNLRVEEVIVPPGSPWIGRRLGDLDPHGNADCVLLATRTTDADHRYNPPDSDPVVDGMVLIVMGEPAGVRKLATIVEGGAAVALSAGAMP
jgi:voltage-gated potassium channel